MMRYIFLLLIVCYACSQTKHAISDNNIPDNTYKIGKIVDEKSYFIIYAQRNDSIFKIVSQKQEIKRIPCVNIEVGKSYNLRLRIIFPHDSILGYKTMNNLDISGTVLKGGVTVTIEERSHYRIYESEDLSGLCYQLSQ